MILLYFGITSKKETKMGVWEEKGRVRGGMNDRGRRGKRVEKGEGRGERGMGRER